MLIYRIEISVYMSIWIITLKTIFVLKIKCLALEVKISVLYAKSAIIYVCTDKNDDINC